MIEQKEKDDLILWNILSLTVAITFFAGPSSFPYALICATTIHVGIIKIINAIKLLKTPEETEMDQL